MQVPLLALAGIIFVELAWAARQGFSSWNSSGAERAVRGGAGAVGVYQVPARDAVRRSLAAP
jgi:long-subunit fatty acid transport protein